MQIAYEAICSTVQLQLHIVMHYHSCGHAVTWKELLCVTLYDCPIQHCHACQVLRNSTQGTQLRGHSNVTLLFDLVSVAAHVLKRQLQL